MIKIGNKFNNMTGVFRISSPEPRVLDFCMAPGGFVNCVLHYNKSAKVDAFSLPPDQGGHHVLVDYAPKDERVMLHFKDVTMFAAEFGPPVSAEHHAAWKSLEQEWPYQTQNYDLVICDGALALDKYRDRVVVESERLLCSQLYLGLKRIRNGGSMIVLLHRINNVRTFRLINLLHECSSIQLFKPPKSHAIKSSFYLLASNVQSESQACLNAMAMFKHIWEHTTFETTSDATYRLCNEFSLEHRSLSEELEEFGSRYIELARPIWNVQANALAAASFTKDSGIPSQPWSASATRNGSIRKYGEPWPHSFTKG